MSSHYKPHIYIYIMYSIFFFIYRHYSTWCTYDLCLLLLSVTYVSMLRLFTTALEFSWLWDFSSAERLGFSRGWRRSRTDDTDAKDLDMALKWSSGDEDCFRAKKPGDLHRKNTQNDDRKSPLPRNNLWKKKTGWREHAAKLHVKSIRLHKLWTWIWFLCSVTWLSIKAHSF